MWKRLFESTIIIGGLVLSLVPYLQQKTDMNTASWIMTGFGIGLVLFGTLFRVFKPIKTHTYLEMQHIVKTRQQYLPKVKECLAQYISHVKYLAENDNRLYSLEEYKEVYFKQGIKGVRKRQPHNRIKEAYWWELYQREKIWKDNAVYRQIKKDDDETKELLNKIEYYIPIITDKKLRRNIQYMIKYSHIAYSCLIWFKLGDELFKPVPKISNANQKRKESIVNTFHNTCSNTFKRIDALLQGAEDE